MAVFLLIPENPSASPILTPNIRTANNIPYCKNSSNIYLSLHIGYSINHNFIIQKLLTYIRIFSFVLIINIFIIEISLEFFLKKI